MINISFIRKKEIIRWKDKEEKWREKIEEMDRKGEDKTVKNRREGDRE